MREAVPIRLQPDGTIKISDPDQKALGIVMATAVEGDLAESWIRFGGVVARPEDEAVLAMPLTGRVEKAKGVELGSDVKAGDFIANVVPVLGTVDQVTLASQRAGLEGQIASARSELSSQETELTRGRKLQAAGLASAQELLRLETTVATSKAQLEGLTSARRAYDRGESARVALKAPVPGRLVFLETAISLTLPAGRTVARILQPGPRWVDVAAPFREPSGARYEVEGAGAWTGGKLLSRGAIVADDGLRRDRIELSNRRRTTCFREPRSRYACMALRPTASSSPRARSPRPPPAHSSSSTCRRVSTHRSPSRSARAETERSWSPKESRQATPSWCGVRQGFGARRSAPSFATRNERWAASSTASSRGPSGSASSY